MRLTRRCVTAALVIGATVTTLAESSSATLPAVAPGGTGIGSATLGTDLKVGLRAYRTGGAQALVDVAAFRYSGGAWRPAWHERVPGDWSWRPLTGRGGVCSLAVTNAGAVTVSLRAPAGCSAPLRFTVD